MRTDVELDEACEHVWYEYWMLQSLAYALRNLKAGTELHTMNAYLESFTIHFRTLQGFFYDARRQPDDMLASDFFEPGQWELIRPVQPNSFLTARFLVGKEIAHLTYHRIKEAKEGWQHTDIAADVRAIMTTFVEQLNHQRFSSCRARLHSLLSAAVFGSGA